MVGKSSCRFVIIYDCHNHLNAIECAHAQTRRRASSPRQAMKRMLKTSLSSLSPGIAVNEKFEIREDATAPDPC